MENQTPEEQQNNDQIDSEDKKEHWIHSKWRPMMGWAYVIINLFDFVIAPIFWSIIQIIGHGSVQTQWHPITLEGAGLFHVSMGGILSVTAWGRTKEKLNNTN